MKLTKNDRVLLEAYQKGYRSDDEGNVWYEGTMRKLTIGLESRNKNKPYYRFSCRTTENYNATVRVHRLQAYQKFGNKIFDKNIVVRHLDDDSLNNHIDNIAIGTRQDNCLDIPKEKRIEYAKHAASFCIKYNAEEVKQFYNSCLSYKQTMERFNIKSKGTLHHILNKR